MAKKDSTPSESPKIRVDDTRDFWGDAQEFMNSQIPADFEKKMLEYANARGYNTNEFRLFKHMLMEAVELHATVVLLKHFNSF